LPKNKSLRPRSTAASGTAAGCCWLAHRLGPRVEAAPCRKSPGCCPGTHRLGFRRRNRRCRRHAPRRWDHRVKVSARARCFTAQYAARDNRTSDRAEIRDAVNAALTSDVDFASADASFPQLCRAAE
jgi:hypothetical protein